MEDLLCRVEDALECLDARQNWVMYLYVLYAAEEEPLFGRWETRDSLKAGLIRYFEHEAANLRGETLEHWAYSLTSAPHPGLALRCRLAAVSPGPVGTVDIEVYLLSAPLGTAALGRFALVMRILPVIPDDEEVLGVISCSGTASVAPHIDGSQRGARGRQCHVFLTSHFRSLLVGPYPGCDLLIPTAARITWVRFDAGDWRLQRAGEPSQPWPEARWSGPDFELTAESQSLGLLGDVLHRKLLAREYSFEVVGRVLPRPAGEAPVGYGADWCDLRSRWHRPVKVSVRLQGGDVLAADDRDEAVLWLATDRQGRALAPSGLSRASDGRLYRWEPDPQGFFYGTLFFEPESGRSPDSSHVTTIPGDQTTTTLLGRGSGLARGSHALLPDYRDDELTSSRGCMRLYSDSTGRFRVEVTEAAPHRRLFLLDPFGRWLFLPDGTPHGAPIALPEPREFVFGASRYRIVPAGPAFRTVAHWSGSFSVLKEICR